MIALPVDLADQLVAHATEPPASGPDHTTHVQVGPGGVPGPLLKDLRYASRTQYVTVWQSPRYRAILLAAQGAGELIFYSRQADFRMAVGGVKRGVLPPLPDRQVSR